MNRKYTAFAMYRLPESSRYVFLGQSVGQPEALASVRELNGREGFVMAPFAPTDRCRVWLMHPDMVELSCQREPSNLFEWPSAAESRRSQKHEVGPAETFADESAPAPADAAEHETYAKSFALFHAQTTPGRFAKLVLSRATTGQYPAGATPDQLFLRACRIYPHQMIALVSMPQTGTWLMATPEVLLESDGREWQTMALAGTMPHGTSTGSHGHVDWSRKNKAEQSYVSAYIRDLLSRHADAVEVHGPYTTMAAHLLHLRTDFRFHLRRPDRLGDLLSDLYPTPAVCGLPKEAAREWILKHEGMDRRYYSGFCGPINPAGDTHLYVSLRCMELQPDKPLLYAGGGILPESSMEQEWEETEAKLQTMRRLLKP